MVIIPDTTSSKDILPRIVPLIKTGCLVIGLENRWAMYEKWKLTKTVDYHILTVHQSNNRRLNDCLAKLIIFDRYLHTLSVTLTDSYGSCPFVFVNLKPKLNNQFWSTYLNGLTQMCFVLKLRPPSCVFTHWYQCRQ